MSAAVLQNVLPHHSSYRHPWQQAHTQLRAQEKSPACQVKQKRRAVLTTAAADSTVSLSATLDEQELVANMLQRIEGTDGGASLSAEEQSEVNDLLTHLEEAGQCQRPRPLDNPWIFGSYDVVYSSTQRAPGQNGQPAGGRFRSSIGRRVFQTTRLCQSILPPDIVTNKVEFLLLGVIIGSVRLHGRFEDVEGNRDTVKAHFQPPRLTLGRWINLPIGPQSTVVLTTTYLSETVRLGKGSRGSLFAFVKDQSAVDADADKPSQTTPAGWLVAVAFLAGLCAAAVALWRSSMAGKFAAAVPLVVAALTAQAGVKGLLQQQPSH